MKKFALPVAGVTLRHFPFFIMKAEGKGVDIETTGNTFLPAHPKEKHRTEREHLHLPCVLCIGGTKKGIALARIELN